MKKILLISFFAFTATINGFAQNGKKNIQPQIVPDVESLFEYQMSTYRLALQYYDIQTGVTALYTALAIKPERTDLKDTLAFLYFGGERYVQANTLAEEVLKNNPKHTAILEIAAVSKQMLGAVKESLTDYENLYKESKVINHLYQIATLQYQLKRYGEATESLNTIISSPDADAQKVAINIGNNQQPQEVPLKAAAYNVRGIIANELNNETVAKQNFETALQLFPDFILAKGNLNALTEKQNKTSGK